MRNTLLIEATDPDLHTVRWLAFDAGGATPEGVRAGRLEEAAALAAGRRVLLLVPATELLLTQARVPSRNRQRILKAVPFALEEQLAGNLDELHFALGPVRGEDHPVAVVARARMDAWLETCAAAGLQPDVLLPEVLALPLEEGQWTLLLRQEQAAVRTGALEGFGCERANLPLLLRQWREQEVPPLRVLGDPAPELAQAGFELREAEPRDPLLVMADRLADGPPLNLLQGRYSRSEQFSRLWRPWRATAALLVAGLVLDIVYLGIDYHRLGQEQARLEVATVELFRQALPGATRMVNPRAQLQQRLAALERGAGGGQAGFLALLGQAGSVLRGTGGLELQGANFRDGTLDLELTVANLQVLDQLKQQLAQAGGLVVEIQSATADADQRVKSRLRIAGGTGS
ncbi:MAG: type II secretion system protein GspL [Xanthomonadaceae bacterium]|nr:type II secretion system protein GspL [Xanthomonadaceae bacterium]